MTKKPLGPIQLPPNGTLPCTLRETYATALAEAERGFRDAQAALRDFDSNDNRAKYARALYNYDRLQASFPFIAAGLGGDAEA